MAGKLSPKAQQKMDTLDETLRKTDRMYALVEQYAGARKGQDAFENMIRNAATDVARVFMRDGLGVLADNSNQIAMTVKRGGPTPTKFRALREMVGSLRAGIERAQKGVLESEKTIPD